MGAVIEPATPLPWRLSEKDAWRGTVVEIEGALNDADYRETVACNTEYYPTPIDPQDAAYIVHAANCFPDLLKALQAVVAKNEMLWGLSSPALPEMDLARAAIAKAIPNSGGSNG